MTLKHFFHIFSDGVRLANSSPSLLSVSICLALLSPLISYFRVYGNSVSLLSIPLMFMNSAFSLSLPFFLKTRQQHEKLSYYQILAVTFGNLKRILLPGLLLFGIAAALLIAVVIYSFQNLDISPTQSPTNSLLWSGLMAIVPICFVLFEFTAVYFSLENRGLLKSMWKSILTILKNKYYAFFLLTAHSIISLSSILLPENRILNLAFLLISIYITFALACVTLVYYQKIIKKI
jgi:hypothetical protein